MNNSDFHYKVYTLKNLIHNALTMCFDTTHVIHKQVQLWHLWNFPGIGSAGEGRGCMPLTLYGSWIAFKMFQHNLIIINIDLLSPQLLSSSNTYESKTDFF